MIREFLRRRKAVLLLYLCVLVFFPLVTFLAGSPMAPVLYSLLIVTFLLVLGLAIDGYGFWQSAKRLDAIKANLSADKHSFPPPADLIDSKYQEIIEELYRIGEDRRYAMESAHADRMEYYTMWVHQIKTPIAAMRLALQSQDENPLINQELFKIERYAEMALQFVKLSSLQADLVIGPCNLHGLVRDSVKKYAPLFIARKLTVSLEDLDVEVETDSKWFSFILEQLLSNAVKYTKQGGVRIYWADGALRVDDTGIGIHSGDIERIFEMGYTGYNGRLDMRASGIGLYMAKKVADSLSIHLEISSQLGAGTQAELRFPKHLE